MKQSLSIHMGWCFFLMNMYDGSVAFSVVTKRPVAERNSKPATGAKLRKPLETAECVDINSENFE